MVSDKLEPPPGKSNEEMLKTYLYDLALVKAEIVGTIGDVEHNTTARKKFFQLCEYVVLRSKLIKDLERRIAEQS